MVLQEKSVCVCICVVSFRQHTHRPSDAYCTQKLASVDKIESDVGFTQPQYTGSYQSNVKYTFCVCIGITFFKKTNSNGLQCQQIGSESHVFPQTLICNDKQPEALFDADLKWQERCDKVEQSTLCKYRALRCGDRWCDKVLKTAWPPVI